jgi:tripartite ATP-independent transporter DctM subunit
MTSMPEPTTNPEPATAPEPATTPVPAASEEQTQEVAASARSAPRGRLYHRLLVVDQITLLALRVVLGVVIAAELVLVLADVADRELLNHSISWELSASEVGLLAIGFLGGALSFCKDEHITVDYLNSRMGPRAKGAVRGAGSWLGIGLAALTGIWAAQSYGQARLQEIPGVSISGGVFALVLTVSMAIIVLNRLIHVWEHGLREAVYGLAIAVAVGAVVAVGAQLPVMTSSPDATVVLATVLTVIVILLGLPVTVGLLLFLVTFILAGHNVASFVPLGLEAGLYENQLLLAIPFFVLAGYLLTEGGLAAAIVDLLAPPLRRVPGGKLQLTVVTMFLFSGMTGVKIADVTAVGTAMTENLVEDGFSRAEIACVLSSTAAAGEAVPPSVAMLILGSVTSISIGTLFIAGILPAVLVMVAVGILLAIRDRRRRRVTAAQPGAAGRSAGLARIVRGVLAGGLPVVLLVGIESGIFTATEASAVAVLYALLITTLMKPRVGPRRLWGVLEQSAGMAGLLLLIVTIASTIGQVLAEAELPQDLAADLTSLGNSKFIFLLIIVAVLPIVGALLEGAPAILIFGPLFVPAAQVLGINLTQFGIVFILALAVGTFSPLLGIGFYTACRVTKATVTDATRQYFPYYAALIVAILVIAFVPDVSLALPRLLGLGT